MSDTTITAMDLTKRFGARTAVNGVTFDARRGEVVGLLGPNGAGKTTLIRLLTTVLAPSGGTFCVAGMPGTEPAGIRRRVGVLPESAGYPADQTGLAYLRYYARLFGRSRFEAGKVAERLLGEVGLTERVRSRIGTYSRGMRQRLGIARALVNQPAVVFLDEPTLGLDPESHRQVLRMVRDIASQRGATVVLSTHNLPDVEDVCTTVLILAGGRVVDSGTVSAVTSIAAAPGAALIRVPAERVGEGRRAIADVAGLRVEEVEDRSDVIRVLLAAKGQRVDGAEVDLNTALRVVLSAGVPVLSYKVEGGRFTDAFLAMTTEHQR